MRVGLVQLNASDDLEENLRGAREAVLSACDKGAEFVLTPEVTNCLANSRTHQSRVLHREADDPTLSSLTALASEQSIWLLIGSLALKTEDKDGRFASRPILINPAGEIAARYDKIHMFDVQISPTEQYRESSAYRPGTKAVVADMPDFKLGMSICYDVRFPHLYRNLCLQGGATALAVPAAFACATGKAHWHSLLRARAIENGAFVLAPAQCGQHKQRDGTRRQTYGHSLAFDPWGNLLGGLQEEPGCLVFDIEPELAIQTRKRVPSLFHSREFEAPK